MLIYTTPMIIWIIMRLMKKIILTWPNPFNAWTCIFVMSALGYIVLNFLLTLV